MGGSLRIITTLCQASVGLSALGICLALGTSAWFWATGLIVFFLIVYGMRWMLQPTQGRRQSQTVFTVALVGHALLVVALFGAAWALWLRLNITGHVSLSDYLFMAAFVLFFICALLLSRLRLALDNPAPWFRYLVGAIGIPLLMAWLLGSVMARITSGPTASELATAPGPELEERLVWADGRGWKKDNGQPIVVALNLSGGGYRAATVHAGFLQTLDDKCVPIRYLTTVSGGSIIGAYYALGNSPREFAEHLSQRKPGLPDDFLSIWSVFAEWWKPGWNSADTYSAHFSKAFFGSKSLKDTTSAPQLIVAATDVEEGSDGR